jgi:hypothetical protein
LCRKRGLECGKNSTLWSLKQDTAVKILFVAPSGHLTGISILTSAAGFVDQGRIDGVLRINSYRAVAHLDSDCEPYTVTRTTAFAFTGWDVEIVSETYLPPCEVSGTQSPNESGATKGGTAFLSQSRTKMIWK